MTTVAERTTVVTRTTALPAPPVAAFAAVNSPLIAPLIDPAVKEWTPDREPVDVGTRFRIRGRLGRIPIRGTSETVEWEPPTLAAYKSVAPTWPIRMTASHRFEGREDGGTDYTWTITFIEVNIIGRPVIALAAKLFKVAQANQAEALHAYLSRP